MFCYPYRINGLLIAVLLHFRTAIYAFQICGVTEQRAVINIVQIICLLKLLFHYVKCTLRSLSYCSKSVTDGMTCTVTGLITSLFACMRFGKKKLLIESRFEKLQSQALRSVSDGMQQECTDKSFQCFLGLII